MSLRLAGPQGSAFFIACRQRRVAGHSDKPYSGFSTTGECCMSTSLAEQKCKPCEGGVRPLDGAAATELLAALHADWSYHESASQISRLFEFPTFSRTIAFTNAVAWIATVEGHHPEMTVNYGSCLVMYRTTAIDGLSDNDFICAAKVDRLVAGS
jgi:4a-hydroxytetrahydrobiopterin dehydratase